MSNPHKFPDEAQQKGQNHWTRRTVEYANRKRTEAPEATKAAPGNPYGKLGACTLIMLMEQTSEFDHGKLDLIRRALVKHYRRERDSDKTALPYSAWRRERVKEARGHTMTALERAIVEAIE